MESLERRIAWLPLSCPVYHRTEQPSSNFFPSQAQYEAIQSARKRQTTQEFKDRYAIRAGIEGPFLKVCEPSTYDEVAILDSEDASSAYYHCYCY